MTIFKQLNPTIQDEAIVLVDGFAFENEDEKLKMFNIGISMEESSWALVIGKLALFQRLFILLSMCANPLNLWQTHKGQFLNVGFFVKQVLGTFRF